VGLGPDFFSDIFQVETSDHARLQLQLSYNWHFVYDPTKQDSLIQIFNVKDFVGDACSAIASKVRGEVASLNLNFENFHKLSARHIRKAFFGLDKEGRSRTRSSSPTITSMSPTSTSRSWSPSTTRLSNHCRSW
jgi:major vault protein